MRNYTSNAVKRCGKCVTCVRVLNGVDVCVFKESLSERIRLYDALCVGVKTRRWWRVMLKFLKRLQKTVFVCAIGNGRFVIANDIHILSPKRVDIMLNLVWSYVLSVSHLIKMYFVFLYIYLKQIILNALLDFIFN